MAQLTQFLVIKGSDSMHVHPDVLATYLADGWQAKGIRYSEGGEGLDVISLVLMVKQSDQIYVHPGDVAAYQNDGYQAHQVIYGADRVVLEKINSDLSFLDTPAFNSAEIGTVADTTVVVTFTTEITADDYAAGVTIKVDDVAAEIASATRQADHTVVHYVIPAVTSASVVTWEYDDATGEISSEVDGTILDDVTAQTVTNNVPAE